MIRYFKNDRKTYHIRHKEMKILKTYVKLRELSNGPFVEMFSSRNGKYICSLKRGHVFSGVSLGYGTT